MSVVLPDIVKSERSLKFSAVRLPVPDAESVNPPFVTDPASVFACAVVTVALDVNVSVSASVSVFAVRSPPPDAASVKPPSVMLPESV